MSDVQRVRQAIVVARRLKGAWNAEAVAAIMDIADPHLPKPLERLGPAGVVALGGLPPAAGRERLGPLVAPAVVGVLLPALRDGMVEGLSECPGERTVADGRPDLPECADAFVTLRTWMAWRQREAEVRTLGIDIGKAILHSAKASLRSMQALVESGDVPDLNALSMDLLRLEGLRWLAEVMRDAPAQRTIAELSRRLARLSLTRAAATIEAFVRTRDLLTLFDNAMVVSQVDNLIVLAQRVLDAQEAGEEEATAFVPTGDERALAEFAAALARLTDALFTLAHGAAGKPGKAETIFPGLVRQIDCLFRFTAHLRHGARPAVIDGIEERVRGNLRTLASQVASTVQTAIGHVGHDPATLRAAVAQARALGTMLERHGLIAESGLIAVRIHAARKVLAV
ncbi:MAG TPA: hypothetical protein VD995_18035 [Azospirillum sp.]|nr:hypothetical protein [Azospirillum sp.]